MELEKLVKLDGKKKRRPCWPLSLVYDLKTTLCYLMSLISLASCSPQVQKETAEHLMHPIGVKATYSQDSNLRLDSTFEPYKPKPDLSEPNLVKPESAPPLILPSKDMYRWIGSTCNVIGYSTEKFPVGGEYEGIPLTSINSIGYNLFDRDQREGTILFPNFRGILVKDREEYPWGNIGDLGIGVFAQKLPFSAGAEWVHRELFEGGSENFPKGWVSYWGDWYGKTLGSETHPFKLWGTQFIEGRYEGYSLIRDLIVDARADINFDIWRFGKTVPREYTMPGIIKINGATLAAFVAGTVSIDTKGAPWNDFHQFSGGLKLIEGPYQIVFEVGHRESWNEGGYEGTIFKVYFALWLPGYFGKHKVTR